MNGGLILEAPRRKNYVRELVFGSASFMQEIKPLNRDTSGIPVVYQGNRNVCVPATLTWLVQYFKKEKPCLSWEWLVDISQMNERGAKPSQVLEPARKVGVILEETWKKGVSDFEVAMKEASNFKLPNYFYITDLSKDGIYHALKDSPIAIGVKDWMGVGPHFMAAYDVTDDGQNIKCKNWWKADVQDEAIVPFEKVVMAVDFNLLPDGFDASKARLPFMQFVKNWMNYHLTV